MRLTRRIRVQLALFTVVALGAATVLIFGYIDLPAVWFGVGRYTVTVELPEAAGLYRTGNVTYRGTNVGRVTDVKLTDTGVEATMSLQSDIPIPSDLRADVHSATAIGEQYVSLTPRSAAAAPLKDGDVIPRSATSVPPDINALLDATNRGLRAIPHDNLTTVIDESYTAFGGLGPELSRIVKGSTRLAIDARKNLEPLITLTEGTKPILDSQLDTADAIHAWATHLATLTSGLQTHDPAVAGVLQKAGPAVDEARQLLTRLKPTLPVLLANLVSLGQVALVYQPALEQMLVMAPQGVAPYQAATLANRTLRGPYKGIYLDMALNLNLPPVCSTGYLPPQQRRAPAEVDYPDRPPGDLYCRVPQDSSFNVRGARNYPCLTVPGKRAPTVKMCESDEQYVPLNDGYNWKGDPNATRTGQDVPQLPPGAAPPLVPAAPPPPPIAAAEYDPATGQYVGPDGRVYTQADLVPNARKDQTWQSMLLPPGA